MGKEKEQRRTSEEIVKTENKKTENAIEAERKMKKKERERWKRRMTYRKDI